MTIVEIHNADVDGRRSDLTWQDGRVRDVRPSPRSRPRSRHAEAIVRIDARGGSLIPGLHDHHIHLASLAAAQTSIRLGPPDVLTAQGLRAALSVAPRGSAGWVRAVGYHESVAGDLDAASLDRISPETATVPVRVQHRSGQLWIFNSVAVAAAGLNDLRHPGVERCADGMPTGRVFGLDEELRRRVPHVTPDLHAVGRLLAAYGVTGVTDLTPTTTSSHADQLAAVALDPAFPVRVHLTGGIDLPDDAGRGLPRGPVKLLPADHTTVDIDALATDITRCHRAGRTAAVHCVSRAGLIVALAAWRDAGVRPGDRIEHGAVIPEDLLSELRDLRLTVVTQPNFVAERGDQYLVDVEPDDLGDLWRCGSLIDCGIGVAGGTDAPFGHPDPWRAINAAMTRTSSSGVAVGTGERIDAQRALQLFLGAADEPLGVRTIKPGTHTDLCLLDEALGDVLAAPSSRHVVATLGRSGLFTAT